MSTKIIIAMHKAYQIPAEDLYIPLQVGAAGKPPIQYGDNTLTRDDGGDNISQKNPNFCELTGLYYAWKNLDADAIGLAHYRRHFSMKSKQYCKKKGRFDSLLTKDEAKALLKRADIVVPAKRKYYIESLYSHYAHTLDASHLDMARQVIGEKYPEDLVYVDRAYKQTWGYMFNMMIMPRPLLEEYCSWLFDILFELENRIDVSGLDQFSARLFGRVSEILFNAWVLKKEDEGMSVIECPVIDMEPVNWPKKIMGFLAAKFFKKKYKKSF